MKISRMIMIIIALIALPAGAIAADPLYARISLLEGDVQIKTQDSGDWGPAMLNDPVGEGDQLWVPDGGRLELQLDSGTYVRLDRESALQVLALDTSSAQFYLSQGHAYIYYTASRDSVMQFDTPDASTRAYDTAVFRIDMSDRYTDVAVYKGSVETENSIGSTRVDAGEMVSLGQDTNGEVAPMGPPDEWERWNKERNDSIFGRRYASSQYLPDELRVYSYDFDENGRWVDVPDYGYCWMPTVIVFQDWAPYRHGRWIWRGGNYVWVGHESWGWAPYHYGRWAFVHGYGWCWVPPSRGDVYWGPGYVGWVRTGNYVAWVPLAPGETYYGRGHYGRHSVNITNINIAQVNVNVYKNVYVNNSVTVVNRNSFNTGSPARVHVQEDVVRRDLFVRDHISVVGPDVKPTRESYFGSEKRIPHAKMPPQRVREESVRELKESRPFERERDRSVMRRGARPESLPVIKETMPRSPGRERPALQQFRPAEKGRPAVPEGRPAPGMERREMPPQIERGGQVAPEGRRELRPQPRMERPEVQPPVERGRTGGPETAPAPRIERREAPPQPERGRPEPGMERRPAPEIRPEPQMERREVKPEPRIERREVAPAPERSRPEVREAVPEQKGGNQPREQIEGPRGEQPMQRFEERGR